MEHLITRIRVGPGNQLSGPLEIRPGFGSIWVLNERGGALVRVNPRTNRIIGRIKLPGSSQLGQYHLSLSIGSGAVWLGSPWLTRVDVRRGRATSISRTLGTTAIGFGYLWLVDANHKILWRLDLHTGKVLSKIRLEPEGFQGLSTVRIGDGSVWVGDTETPLLFRIDPHSLRVVKRMRLGYGPEDILFSGRRVWIVDGGKPNDYLTKAGCTTFYELDPRTYAVKATVHLGLNGGVPAITAGGRLWVRPTPSLLVALDASNGHVEEALQGFPSSLYAGGILSAYGSLWVTNWQDGTVWRARA